MPARSIRPSSMYTVVLMQNRFNGLDLIDWVPDELWMEVRDTVQEGGIKTTPKGKKNVKRWNACLSSILQIAVKRREMKSKREKERYTHLNPEFQRIARRDKKAFLNDQFKEIEENNRMGKTRKWLPTPVFLPGKSHGLRSLVGYSPWGCQRVGHDLETKY